MHFTHGAQDHDIDNARNPLPIGEARADGAGSGLREPFAAKRTSFSNRARAGALMLTPPSSFPRFAHLFSSWRIRRRPNRESRRASWWSQFSCWFDAGNTAHCRAIPPPCCDERGMGTIIRQEPRRTKDFIPRDSVVNFRLWSGRWFSPPATFITSEIWH